jgi:hypothetical protein
MPSKRFMGAHKKSKILAIISYSLADDRGGRDVFRPRDRGFVQRPEVLVTHHLKGFTANLTYHSLGTVACWREDTRFQLIVQFI